MSIWEKYLTRSAVKILVLHGYSGSAEILSNLHFHNSRISNCRFFNGTVLNLNVKRSQLHNCRFDNVRFSSTIINEVTSSACMFENCT